MDSIITALAALAGVTLTWAMRRLDTRTARRTELRDALHDLLGALTALRRHQYLKIGARRDGGPDTTETRTARYEARSAVTDAMDHLALLAHDPRLLSAAEAAVAATFALGDASGHGKDAVKTAGDHARTAHNALRRAAANHLHH